MELGRLESVAVREVWAHEALDFTPWLLENPDRLAEVLGIDLELDTAEHPVGGFSLDLMGRDLSNDCVLIVENQLEGTDHAHLGQILTYAAGTGASTIVWVAARFREEHRLALDWLNEQTAPDVHFFGVSLAVVRIGTSAPAPLLEVVAKPNDWQKQIRGVTRESSAGKGGLYRAFWAKYLERVQAEHPSWTRARAPQSQNWMNAPTGRSGIIYGTVFASGERLSHELYIDVGDADSNSQIFDGLLAQRNEIEANSGLELDWQALPDRRACRIAAYRHGSIERAEEYDDYLDWFIDTGVRLRNALSERL